LGKILAGLELNKEIVDVLAKMNKMFRMSYEFFYKPEKKKCVDAFLFSKEIKRAIDKALHTKNSEEIKALIAIDFSTRIIYHLTTMRLDTLKELSGVESSKK